MLTVHLHQLVFHAFHGLYEGEERIGNDFEVNLDVCYEVGKNSYDSLDHLISYEHLYELVRLRMQIPTPLLEEVADSIIRKVHHEYRQIKSVRISIHKLNAPIERFQGRVGISLFRNFG